MITTARTSNGEYEVRVIGQSADLVVRSAVFQAWFDRFDFRLLDLRMIVIQSAHIFEGGRVLFATLETEVFSRENGRQVPGIVFLRGPAVSIFMLVRCQETLERFVLLTEQVRVPLGQSGFVEAVAGMLDKNDGVVGRAITEIKEETSIIITPEDLWPLGTFVPSAGGCDEHIECFWTCQTLPQAQIESITARLHGAEYENEVIKLRLLSIAEFIGQLTRGEITDGKVIVSLALLMLQQDPQAFLKVLVTALDSHAHLTL